MSAREKIKSISELAEIVSRLRTEDKCPVVYCHGVFDLLHIGHIRYFEQAKRMGSVLVVTVTPDEFVDKGPHRPAFTETLRAEAVASLDCVDYVAINQWPTAAEALRALRPDFYVKGAEFKDISSDMTGKMAGEAAVVKEIGAKLAFTDDIVFSSTNLINRHLSNLPKEIDDYLGFFRRRFALDEILDCVDQMGSLRVMVIGDAILDDYNYCQPLGMSSKDPCLALKYQANDVFAGGVLAVANHVASFCDRVTLVTVIGGIDGQEDFIRSQLLPNIDCFFITRPGAPTTTKRRFLDGYAQTKLFEVYVIDDSPLNQENEAALLEFLRVELPRHELLISADYGHGSITEKVRTALCDRARFLAVNTQANAGNRGFHTIGRYNRADYVCLAEHEMRLEYRDMIGDVHPMIENAVRRLNTLHFAVTRGRRGCVICGKSGYFIEVPSFAQRVIDRVGAGDAFFAVSAMASLQGRHEEIVGFIGNIAGCLAVEMIGNLKPIDKLSMKKYMTALMK